MADLTQDVTTKLILDASGYLDGIRKADAAAQAAATKEKGYADASKRRFDESGDAAIAEAKALDQMQREYAELTKSVNTLKTALKGAYDPRAIAGYTKAIAQGEAGLKRYEQAAKAVGASVTQVNKEAGTGKQVFEQFFGAFSKVAIITGAIALVGKLTGQALSLAAEYEKAQKSFESFLGSAEAADKTLAQLSRFAAEKFLPTDQVFSAGKALLAFGESADNLVPVMGRIADISAATGKNFGELAVIYGKARTAGVLYAEDINQLVEAGIPIIQEFAKQMGVSNDQVKKLASEGKISFEELQLAFFNLTAEGGKFFGQVAAQSETLGGQWDKLINRFTSGLRSIGNALSENFLKPALTFFNDGFVDLPELLKQRRQAVQAEADKAAEQLITGEVTKEKTIFDIAKTGNAEREALEAAAAKRRAELNKKKQVDAKKAAEELEKIELERAKLRLQLTDEGTAKEVAAEQLRFESLLKELNKYFKGRAELKGLIEKAEKEHNENLADIYADELSELTKALDAQTAQEQKAIEGERERREADVKDTKKYTDAYIDLAEEKAKGVILRLKAQGAKESELQKTQQEFDLQIQRARLVAELQFQEGLLATTKEGDAERIREIEAQIALIKEKISNIDVSIETGDGGKKKPFSLLSLVGLDPDSDEAKQLEDATRQIVDSLQQITAARVAAAEENVRLAQENVQTAEDALDREIELAELGFANNVEARRKELEDAKAAQAKALEEKRKAQRAQLAIDAASQASSLATSATNLISSWSSLPYGVGLAIAFAQIAAMIGFIVSVRARARAISAQSFGEGGEASVSGDSIVTGPSHAGGGVGIEVEGGEFMTSDGKRISIVNKRMTKQHFGLLKAVNRNDVPGMVAEVSRLAEAKGIPGPALNYAAASGGVSTQTAGQSAQQRNEEIKQLKEANRNLREMVGQLKKETGTTQSAGGVRIETRGNKKRTVWQ